MTLGMSGTVLGVEEKQNQRKPLFAPGAYNLTRERDIPTKQATMTE